jgi:hypothetical protein
MDGAAYYVRVSFRLFIEFCASNHHGATIET